MTYKGTIGLEIHAELKTESKMFCRCLNDSKETEPNVNICPICMGHPGSLPIINQKAVESVIKVGLAIGGKVNNYSKFDRKSYFYPDLPKGYQISQYDLPLVKDGFLEIDGKKIRINRVHLEEDTGKLSHDKAARCSLVDYNRAGRPLMELVTEPDMESGQEAKKFCEELQLILRYLNVSNADMEKGEMRCEVNISIAPDDNKGELGTKVEIKNLNSFRAVERAINYEIKRQSKILKEKKKVIQETRGWNEKLQKTSSQRTKEEAADYRYLPEPDLPPLEGLENIAKAIKGELVEMPQAKRKRFQEEYKLNEDDVSTLVVNKDISDYFEQIISELDTWAKIKEIEDRQSLVKLTVNYLLTELQRLLAESKTSVGDCKISADNFAELIASIKKEEISSSAAQTVLIEMFNTGADPSNIIEEKDLKQVSDQETLAKIIKKVISENQKSVNDYKGGKDKALQFLVGQVMAKSRGQANPQVARRMIIEKIK